MVNINPNAVSLAAQAQLRRRSQEKGESDTVYKAPKSRASLNFIPSPESLDTLIRSAVAALRKGVFWDRGTILNILT